MLKNGALSESEEQTLLFNWASYIPELKWMFAVPNGGSRNPIEAAKLKRQGVKAGISDIFLPAPRGNYHGLFIEMKVGKNKPTKKQLEFIEYAKTQGYAACVCYGYLSAIELIKQYLKGEKLQS